MSRPKPIDIPATPLEETIERSRAAAAAALPSPVTPLSGPRKFFTEDDVSTLIDSDLVPDDPALVRGTLPSGMRYILKECNRPRGIAEIRMVVHVGSAHELPDEIGVAHLVEHLVFGETEFFPDHEIFHHLHAWGASLGADTNATTSAVATTYQYSVPSMSVPTALQIVVEMMFHALFSDEAVYNERHVVIEELTSRVITSPLAKLFPGNAMSRDVGGSVEDVSRLTPAIARRFYKQWYRPENMTLVIVGDTEPDRVEHALKYVMGTSERSCAICGKRPAQRCSGCSTVAYCTTACQQAHWSTHKVRCSRIGALSERMNAVTAGMVPKLCQLARLSVEPITSNISIGYGASTAVGVFIRLPAGDVDAGKLTVGDVRTSTMWTILEFVLANRVRVLESQCARDGTVCPLLVPTLELMLLDQRSVISVSFTATPGVTLPVMIRAALLELKRLRDGISEAEMALWREQCSSLLAFLERGLDNALGSIDSKEQADQTAVPFQDANRPCDRVVTLLRMLVARTVTAAELGRAAAKIDLRQDLMAEAVTSDATFPIADFDMNAVIEEVMATPAVVQEIDQAFLAPVRALDPAALTPGTIERMRELGGAGVELTFSNGVRLVLLANDKLPGQICGGVSRRLPVMRELEPCAEYAFTAFVASAVRGGQFGYSALAYARAFPLVSTGMTAEAGNFRVAFESETGSTESVLASMHATVVNAGINLASFDAARTRMIEDTTVGEIAHAHAVERLNCGYSDADPVGDVVAAINAGTEEMGRLITEYVAARPSQMTFVLVGDLPHDTDKVMEAACLYLGSLKDDTARAEALLAKLRALCGRPAGTLAPMPSEMLRSRVQYDVYAAADAVAHVCVSIRVADCDSVPARLALDVVGEAIQTKLFECVRGRSGLVYEVRVGIEYDDDAHPVNGVLKVTLLVHPRSAAMLINETMGVLMLFHASPDQVFSDADIRSAQEVITRRYLEMLSTHMAVMGHILSSSIETFLADLEVRTALVSWHMSRHDFTVTLQNALRFDSISVVTLFHRTLEPPIIKGTKWVAANRWLVAGASALLAAVGGGLLWWRGSSNSAGGSGAVAAIQSK